MYLNDAIGHSALQPVYMQTEAGTAYAAYGWALCTGQMGVLCVTSGLAQTNALSGVASAFSDYMPMMVISGDINSDLIIKRDKEGLRQGGQQDVPIVQIANSVTKGVMLAISARHVKMNFEYLWELALSDPKGPCWLDIPIDVQQADIPE